MRVYYYSTVFQLILFLKFFHLLLASEECSLYIAPSSRSTEDTFLLGVFSGIDFQPGDRIGPSDIAIPIIDVEFHNSHRFKSSSPSSGKEKEEDDDDDDNGEEDDDDPDTDLLPRNFFNPIAKVLWTPYNTGARMEIYGNSKTKGSNVIVSIPGIGLLARDSPSIINADFNQAWILNRTLTTDFIEEVGISHPGRGAYTSYSPIIVEAKTVIPAGSEIFIDYGIKYDKTINFKQVDKAIQQINTFFSKHDDELSPSQKQTLYSFFVQDVIPYSGRKTSDAQTKLLQAFPKTVDELPTVLQTGGSFIYQNPQAMKTLSWLQRNGQCMDGFLYPGISSIPYAGRGAFAKKNILAGQVIAPMPLLKIDDESWLDMYKRDVVDTGDGKAYSIRGDVNDPVVIHKQLMLNYCFGHPSSSILLHPVSSVVNLINHQPNSQGANCKIAWSNHTIYNQDWLHMSVEELKQLNGYGIGFDLIATRDILADEEVFLDYGKDWEGAWKEHVDSWPYDDIWPPKALEWNLEIHRNTFFTITEREELMSSLGSDPYPENIETLCQVAWNEHELSDGSTILTFDSNIKYEKVWIGDNMFRCDIIERDVVEGGNWDNMDDYFYTINLHPSGETVEKVPHHFIRFHDKAYTSDMHNPQTFRHPIGIHDSIFPEAWRNLEV